MSAPDAASASPEAPREGWLDLAAGPVRFTVAGPPGAPGVLLIHGIVGPHAIWAENLPALAAAGLRVAAFDLYGRGRSARPRARHTLALYVEQALGVADGLGLGARFDVVGLSMGGAVAVGLADAYPARVGRVALLAPAGVPRERPWRLRLARRVLSTSVGDALVHTLGPRIVREGLKRSFRDASAAPVSGFVAEASAQTADPGFRRALRSSARCVPVDGMLEAFARVGRDREVLVVWGEDDRVAPIAGLAHVRAAMPNAAVHVLPGGAHNVNREEPERVNALLLPFLRPAR